MATKDKNPDNWIDGNTDSITDTTETTVIAAQGSGVVTYIQHISVQNSDAAVGTWVKIMCNGVRRHSVYAGTNGGGATIELSQPIRGVANQAWTAQCETTSAEVRVFLGGYKAKES